MQEQAHGTHDGQPGDRKRLATRNSDANGKECADCVCECRSKRTAPTMGSPAAGSVWPPGSRRMLLAGSVWPPGIRMPTADIALILCVNAGASAWHPRCAARRQEASGRQEFGCQP